MIFPSGTIAASQIYGGYSGTLELEETPGQSEQASGSKTNNSKSSAMFYVGLIVLLVLLRLSYEYAK